MKKLLVLFSMIFILSGCTAIDSDPDLTAEINDSAEASTVQQQQKSTSNNIAEDDNSFVCSPENPPKVVFSKVGEVLSLCGKIGHRAYDFSEYGYILYFERVESVENEAYNMRKIMIQEPYTDSVIEKNIPYTTYFEKEVDNVHIGTIYGSGPGNSLNLSMFNPQNEKYLFVSNHSNLYGDLELTIVSSEYPEVLKTSIDTANKDEEELLYCNLGGNALDYDDDTVEKRIHDYVSAFPDKINCYSDEKFSTKIIGYIDLEKMEYVEIVD